MSQSLWDKQNKALRNPLDVVSASFTGCGITGDSLKYKADSSFASLLHENKITLLLTREYENLAVALSADKNKMLQTIMPLPHPSGIAVDRKKNRVYIAATRNPNQIIEFVPANKTLLPARTKYYPGSYYFHDLAIIADSLYANSVGKNGIIKVDWNNAAAEELLWHPKCVEDKHGKPLTDRNHIQLNSIAAGKSLSDSFFSASGDKITKQKPGDTDYKVDKTGVIFSGKTRKPVAGGLTRPHSAKLYNGRLYTDNSGYGEFGRIEKGKFTPLVKLPGWTRGLCIHNDIAFIGVSRILPKFRHYAPGIKGNKQVCGIFAYSLSKDKLLGSITWDAGNQVFGIDFIDSPICKGFYYQNTTPAEEEEKNIFYRYH